MESAPASGKQEESLSFSKNADAILEKLKDRELLPASVLIELCDIVVFFVALSIPRQRTLSARRTTLRR